MNLIPFQFIVSQRQNPTPGVLILSEFAGSSEALRDAMIINPWGTDQVAEAIYTAINMSEDEKIQCFNTLYRHISTYTQESWATNFLYSLSTIDDKVITIMFSFLIFSF